MELKYEVRPMVGFKLNNRQFEFCVLKAILEIQSERGSVLGLPTQWETWGWASRQDLSEKLGYSHCSKSLSRKIREAFLWLEEKGYLRHQDVNQPGNERGATRFFLSFWVFRVALGATAKFLGEARQVVSKAVQEVSRTCHVRHSPEEVLAAVPPGLLRSPLMARLRPSRG